jgi:hypothetical protein
MTTSKRYLVYQIADGLCTNCIVWDGESEYNPGDGFAVELVPAGSFATTGWTRISESEWQEPAPVEVEEE